MQMDLSVLLKELVNSYKEMLNVVNSIDYLTSQTKLLSFNSSIEAARAGEAGKGFAVVSKEIKSMADESEKANKNSIQIINNIHEKMNVIIAVRTADIAFDIIDKIERNLFERNCDIQSWANYDKIINCLSNFSTESQNKAIELLDETVEIYPVYLDIFLTDKNGKLVAAGKNKNMVGKDFSEKEWFKNTIRTHSTYVSDMYYSEALNKPTISYSCPVKDSDGNIIGVISSRLNWDCISNIIDMAKIGQNSEIYVVNKDGLVIASKNKSQILKKDLSDTPAVKKISGGDKYGYIIDSGKNKTIVTGYAHSLGHNIYKGKGWSVIVKEIF